MTEIPLEHHILKADLEGAAQALGVSMTRDVQPSPGADDGCQPTLRSWVVKLPAPTAVRARFVREGLLERAKKLFVDEVEVGSAVFDDLIFVITSTRQQTAALLANERVQQALLLLVDETRCVSIEGDELRLTDSDTSSDDSRDARAELLALAAHLLPAHPAQIPTAS